MYLGLSQAITLTIGTLMLWYVQCYWKISTKKMFDYLISYAHNNPDPTLGYHRYMDQRVWVRHGGSSNRKDRKFNLVDSTFHCAEDTHIRVDTTNGGGEHAIEICVRKNDESDQITQSEEAVRETK